MTNCTQIMAFLLMVATVSATNSNADKSPNILLILVDDMGYSDLGCYGGEIKTPVIDALASSGLRYSQFYNSARCVPTRAALLSGYYPQQINRDFVLDVKGGASVKRPKWAPLLPNHLNPLGYRSYQSGKWHIDGKVMDNGFDQSLDISISSSYFKPKTILKNGKRIKPHDGFYSTTAIADHAIEVLKDHQLNYADKPFFSYVAFTAPHFPLHALPEDISRVGNRYKAGWDTIRNQRWERLQKMGLVKGDLSKVEYKQGPPMVFDIAVLGENEVNRPIPWGNLNEKQKEFQQMKMAIHAAMIERLDIEVGRIIEQLKAMNCFDDTVIFVLSDNGASAEMMVRGNGHDPEATPGSAGSYLCLGPGWSTVANTPFRKHKIWAHEGGICTPFIVHWPKQISQAGEIRETLGHVIDIVPTILDLAGAKPQKQKVPFPGQSLLSSFKENSVNDRTFWWSHKGNHALRSGDWKLVKSDKGKWELYKISEDRAETNDLAAQYPEKIKALKKQWEAQVEQIRQIKKLKLAK